MRQREKTPLLLKVMHRLGTLEVNERWLPRDKDNSDTYALWGDDGTITINPIPHVVDSLLHETLHDLFPEYAEQSIRSLTGKLRRMLSAEDEQAIYAEYKRKLNVE